MKRYAMPLGRTIGYTHAHPERTAQKAGRNLFSDITFQVWPSREAMARSVRMQQKREPQITDWRPLVKLSDTEGR